MTTGTVIALIVLLIIAMIFYSAYRAMNTIDKWGSGIIGISEGTSKS